jgi:hypothetical protein
MNFKSYISALLLTVAMAIPTQADNPWSPFATYGWGFAGAYGGYRNNVPTPPYFALHPPVYYGKRYQRPYGDSPFASWSTLQPNPAYMPTLRPESRPRIVNPYFEGAVIAGPEVVIPSGPKTIENPFTR